MTEEDEGLFETVGRAADKIGETSMGKRIGAIVTILLLAALSGGANMTVLHDYWNGGDDGPIAGCMQTDATNYNSKATFDDGSCNFLVIIYGCVNPEAENYNSQATHDDGRCIVIENPNGTTNETAAIYGCMDTTANNYDDKATEDDGTCDYEDEYEEPECNSTGVHFYPGWTNNETGNSSVFSVNKDAPKGSMSILTDVDADCPDSEIDVLVYIDAELYIEEEDEYVWYSKEVNFTVYGMEWDEHWLNMSWEDLNETEGEYEVYVSLWIDTDGDGDGSDGHMEYMQYFYIPKIRVEAE